MRENGKNKIMSNKWGLTPPEIPETVYGHTKRLFWMMDKLETFAADRRKSDVKILEIGCGTGIMISIPLASLGYNVTGVDTDEKSIDYAISINPHKNARFLAVDAASLERGYDCIILAEVLEHVDKPGELLSASYKLLRDGGLLLVSVPNGYGWFEFEQFLCEKLKADKIIWRLGIRWVINAVKWKLTKWEESPRLSTLSSSPHVQRFTYSTATKVLAASGFKIFAADGSALFSGRVSALCFNGYRAILKINNRLGSIFKPIASGYYFACRKF